ncbi:hypothetical protein L596_020926 [Steinernema carpocapsae]|nr:hypothetical protein L596_020923 [Steinernema carpocapsae]TKR73636.1 hypothetical protein L596_020926 [Steinernema carpocapsae]
MAYNEATAERCFQFLGLNKTNLIHEKKKSNYATVFKNILVDPWHTKNFFIHRYLRNNPYFGGRYNPDELETVEGTTTVFSKHQLFQTYTTGFDLYSTYAMNSLLESFTFLKRTFPYRLLTLDDVKTQAGYYKETLVNMVEKNLKTSGNSNQASVGFWINLILIAIGVVSYLAFKKVLEWMKTKRMVDSGSSGLTRCSTIKNEMRLELALKVL